MSLKGVLYMALLLLPFGAMAQTAIDQPNLSIPSKVAPA